MSTDKLQLRGLGVFLPASRSIDELVAEAGGDPSAHRGWERKCVAGDDDHPGTMATAALTRAMAEARVEVGDLDLVISTGVSRDFPGSWLTSIEVMRLLGASPHCLGFDLQIGCLGSVVALNAALGWLQTMGGGTAAIVTAERWSQTIDHGNADFQPLWGHADGAAAMIVTLGRPGRSLATFEGAVFNTHHEFNGLILQKYGGTRFPWADDPSVQARRTLTQEGSKIWPVYRTGYARAAKDLRARFGVPPSRLICNQISPKIVAMISEEFGISTALTHTSGHTFGHVGGADIVIGLRDLIDHDQIDGAIAVSASAAFGFGAALLTPPGAQRS